MKKITESTLGTRLSNAQHLATVLAGFENYKPPRSTDSIGEYSQLITAIRDCNNAAASNKAAWTLAIAERKQLAFQSVGSIRGLLIPIRAAIKAQYGHGSKEAADIVTKARSLRGERKRSAKLIDAKEGEMKHPSSSHLGIGSVMKGFADVIATISKFSPAFDPANPNISIINLKKQHDEVLVLNDQVSTSRTAWDLKRSVRDELYAELKIRSKRIKDSVKSQYGHLSAQYAAIKAILI